MFCWESSWAATRPARPAPTIMTGLGGGVVIVGVWVEWWLGVDVDVDLGLRLLPLEEVRGCLGRIGACWFGGI